MSIHPARIFFTLSILAASLLLLADPAAAQEMPAFKPEVAPRESTLTLWQLIKDGGWSMIPLGAFSVAVAALVIRNALALQHDKLLRPDLYPALRKSMAERDIGTVRDLCVRESGLLPAVLAAGLERLTGSRLHMEKVKEAIEEAGTEQLMTYMTPVSYLSIIGAVAPMLGLLGTVSGMIKAFQNIASGGMGKAELLAGNIGEALITTATGLIIAIPAMLFYFYFKHRFMKYMAAMGRMVGGLLDTLESGEIPVTHQADGPAESPEQSPA